MTTLVLPDPSLVVLVGAAGAGKSTFAARHFAPGEILSSDALRLAIAGDARDQRATRAAFAALHQSLAVRLGARRLTVVDATSVERHARLALLRRAWAARLPALAVVLDLPADEVLARNAARAGGPVDPAVVRHHLDLLRGAVDGGLLEAEGWDQLAILRDPPAVEAVTFVRAAAPIAARPSPR